MIAPSTMVTGIVAIQPSAILRTVFHFTPRARSDMPIPTTPDEITCPVLMGIPSAEEENIMTFVAICEESDIKGFILNSFCPIVMITLYPPKRIPSESIAPNIITMYDGGEAGRTAMPSVVINI